MRKKRLNFVIVFFIGLLLGITISYVYLAKQEAKPPIKEADLLACQADEDCVCYDGCGCINKQYVGKVYCIQILQP
ncbi:MAG: hypothetical protein QMD12_03200, partial [Candidatus Aenigmarchaeota archaeon]|nr:hypothetical protein [Candidatus Aenigmarchaeota archaeon]